MMDIGEMGMTVRERLVLVGMRVRLFTIPGEIMRVLMMFIVAVTMVVRHRLMHMRVRMTFADV